MTGSPVPLTVPPDVIDALERAFTEADRLWDRGISRTRAGEIACRAGCLGCCVGLYEISLPEALLVVAGYRLLPLEDREDIWRRATRIASKTRTGFPGDPDAGILDPERSEEADDRYFETVADTPCPMLELPAGRCRIYAFRPITCRTYGLAWKREGSVLYQSCLLNFAGEPEVRQSECGVDLELLDDGLQAVSAFATEAGLPLDSETTLAHVVTGSAFHGRTPPFVSPTDGGRRKVRQKE